MRLIVGGGRAAETEETSGAVVLGVRTLSKGGRVGNFTREQNTVSNNKDHKKHIGQQQRSRKAHGADTKTRNIEKAAMKDSPSSTSRRQHTQKNEPVQRTGIL